MVHHLLHQGLLTLVHGAAGSAEVSVCVGLHYIEVKTYFVGQSLHVGVHAEDADGACQGSGLGHDGVGIARHVVSARGGIFAHGDDDGLLFLQLADGIPQLLGAVGTSAG